MFKVIRRIGLGILIVLVAVILIVVALLASWVTTPEVIYAGSVSGSPASDAVIDTRITEMQSAGVLAFAPDNALLVADSQTGTIFAFEVQASAPADEPTPYNIFDIDLQIASLLGTTVDDILINDLAVHPIDHTAYLSVMRGHGDIAIPLILNVTSDGEISVVNLADLPYTSVMIDSLPDEDVVYWSRVTARSLSITDIDYYDGNLYIAGLSNSEFSSELRRIPYPFDGSVAYASTEIYHAIHDQNETRAPIRTQTIIDNGADEPILLAAYTCTPLVTIPLNEVQDGVHIDGKTIAELGYGNTPIDVIQFEQQMNDGSVQDMVIITHTDYSAMVLSVEQVLTRNEEAGLTEVVALGAMAGIDPFITPLSGVLQISDLDSQHLLMLQINLASNRVNLVSTVKGEYFRPDDFLNEADLTGS